MGSLPEDWKNIPDTDPFLARAKAITEGKGQLTLSILARMCMQDLAGAWLREAYSPSGSVPKESATHYPRAEPLYSEVVPAKIEGTREVLWLKLNGRMSEGGYRTVEVLDMPLRTDVAILAAGTAFSAKPVDVDHLDDSVINQVLDTSEEGLSLEEAIQALTDLEEEVLEQLVSSNAYDDPSVTAYVTLEYVAAMLRHYRPEFDDLPYTDRADLLKEGCRRVKDFLESLRKLVAFLDYGAPGKDLRQKMEKAASDVRAAELRDIDDLTKRQMGNRLGLPETRNDEVRRTNQTAGDAANRGRGLLISALGEDGWQQHIEAKKAERERFLSQSQEERNTEELADRLGVDIEFARKLLE